jgi:hypothetical protein
MSCAYAACPCQRSFFSGPSPLEFASIFYCLRFETSLFVASYDSQGQGGGIWPRLHTNQPIHWIHWLTYNISTRTSQKTPFLCCAIAMETSLFAEPLLSNGCYLSLWIVQSNLADFHLSSLFNVTHIKMKALTEVIYPNLLGFCLHVTLFGYVYRISLSFPPLATFFSCLQFEHGWQHVTYGRFGDRRVCNVRSIRLRSRSSHEHSVTALLFLS